MIYSCIVWYNGYIFTTDDPTHAEATSIIAAIVVPKLMEKEGEFVKMYTDMVLFGSCAMDNECNHIPMDKGNAE